ISSGVANRIHCPSAEYEGYARCGGVKPFANVTGTSCGVPPLAGTRRSLPPNHGPLAYRMCDPSGDHEGRLPAAAMRRALPPNAGMTQMSPPLAGLLGP